MVKDMFQKRKEKGMSNDNTQQGLQKSVINWYPGHMAKTIKKMKEDIKLVDLVIEILDARIPISSQNPDIKKILQDKDKIIVLNKSDLASEVENKKWINYFQNNNTKAILCDATNGNGVKNIFDTINNMMQQKINIATAKGRIGKIIRVMIVGIPNVGKSSLINRMSNKSSMQVGNKPGVTKQNQWIRLSNNIELLDTPGVLWPRFDSEKVALNLSYTGTIKSEILDETEIAYDLTKYLLMNYRKNLLEKYQLDEETIDSILSDDDYQDNEKIVKIMNRIGKNRGAIIKGGNIDLQKTSKIILDDFKNGKLGRITLEKVGGKYSC